MPDLNGLELVAELRKQDLSCKFIMLSTFARSGYVERALELGIEGYLLKESPPEMLLNGISNVMHGVSQIDSRLMRQVVTSGHNLSERERVILRFIREGKTNDEIAASLYLSSGTVRNNVSEIIGKLQVDNRVKACRLAEDNGWI